ncbi:MAG TPA: AAA family ATPase [Verrucomicrobiae bacterium]|nr:AAA family ATPase [Verrucomicrobiae bacterium]
MSDTIAGRALELPHVQVNNPDLIAECLDDGKIAVVHRHATMEKPYEVEVTATRHIANDVGHLSLHASFAFNETVIPSQIATLRERYLPEIKGLFLGSAGIGATYVGNEKKSLRLAFDDGKTSITTWFSRGGVPPYHFYASNNRRDGLNNNRISSSPPKFERATLEEDLANYMRLLSVVDRVLGGSSSKYTIDFIEQRSPRQQQRTSSKRSKNQHASKPEGNQSEQAQANTKLRELATSLNEKYAPRLPNPNARLEDIHGIDPNDWEKLEERILVFSNPELAKQWNVKSGGGILLLGPAGTGKTMTAAAICNKIGARIWQVDGPDIVNMYVGNSAKYTAALFENAVKVSKLGPLVLLFDEIDSVVVSKDMHAERASVLGQFKKDLAYMANQVPNVLVIGTTNHAENLDEAFIRSGRFDVKIYMKHPDERTRLQIFMDHITLDEAQGTRQFDETAKFDFAALAKSTDGMTGADIALIVKNCRYKKFRAHVQGSIHPGSISQHDIINQINIFREQPQAF